MSDVRPNILAGSRVPLSRIADCSTHDKRYTHLRYTHFTPIQVHTLRYIHYDESFHQWEKCASLLPPMGSSEHSISLSSKLSIKSCQSLCLFTNANQASRNCTTGWSMVASTPEHTKSYEVKQGHFCLLSITAPFDGRPYF